MSLFGLCRVLGAFGFVAVPIVTVGTGLWGGVWGVVIILDRGLKDDSTASSAAQYPKQTMASLFGSLAQGAPASNIKVESPCKTL